MSVTCKIKELTASGCEVKEVEVRGESDWVGGVEDKVRVGEVSGIRVDIREVLETLQIARYLKCMGLEIKELS